MIERGGDVRMKEIIEVFRMEEVSKEARCKIIAELGELINYKYGANLTEVLVYELIYQLCPNHQILSHVKFKKCARYKVRSEK